MPPGKTIYVNCQHDASCEFAAAGSFLSSQAGSACSAPSTFSFGTAPGSRSMTWGYLNWPTASPDVSVVTSSIAFDDSEGESASEIITSTIHFDLEDKDN